MPEKVIERIPVEKHMNIVKAVNKKHKEIAPPVKEPIKRKKPSPAKQRGFNYESKITNKIKLSI